MFKCWVNGCHGTNRTGAGILLWHWNKLKTNTIVLMKKLIFCTNSTIFRLNLVTISLLATRSQPCSLQNWIKRLYIGKNSHFWALFVFEISWVENLKNNNSPKNRKSWKLYFLCLLICVTVLIVGIVMQKVQWNVSCMAVLEHVRVEM